MRGKLKDCPMCGAAPNVARTLVAVNGVTARVTWRVICPSCRLVRTGEYPTCYVITEDETFKRTADPETGEGPFDGFGQATSAWNAMTGKDAQEDLEDPLDVTVDESDVLDVMGVTPGVSGDYETAASAADVEEVLNV